MDAMMPKLTVDYKSPPHKVISFLRAGRDKLRSKYAALRIEMRRVENQVRAVTNSREMWEERARLAEAELAALKKSQ
jgi:predicted  nucleic acid-binding Zn-ribbon protein